MSSVPTHPTQSSYVILKRLAAYIVPFWPVLLIGVVANVAYAGVDAAFAYMLKPFLDEGVIEENVQFIAWVPLLVLVGISLRGIVSAVAGYCMTWVARHVVNRFRQQLFSHMLYLPASFYDRATSGKLLSKLLYDVEQIAHASADALTTLVQSFCLVIGLMIVMFYISWPLASLFLLTVPFIGLIVNYANKRTRRISHAAQQSMGEVTEIAEETIEGYRVVRVYGGQDYERGKFHAATEQSRIRDMKVAATKAFNVAAVQIIVAIGIAGIVLLTVQLSSKIVITPGGFLSIVAAMLMLVKPLKQLTMVNSVIQRGLAGAESVFSLLDHAAEKDQGKQQLKRAQGKIEYRQIHLAYLHDRAVLHEINLSIQPGETVAIVGRSGGGKSSLVSLLPRFYEPTAGNIYIDDIDIRELGLSHLRSQIALVTQHTTLFNDTVANNIAYGVFSDVSKAEVERAAVAAYAMNFIADLPQGMDTMVGENGVMLSGGQRQRISLARAILKDAPILILDEATSALDSESEQFIQAALTEIMQNRTTLVIAHRLSTIEKADRIIVLDDGRIVEQGGHQELLAKNGYYAALYHMQFASHVA